MNAITSIYIPHVETYYSADYVADVLDRSGIAKVSKIAFEHNDKYKRAWIDIKAWRDTEAAYNFINRLRNPSIETRLVHASDYWWAVEINKFPHKTDSSKAKNQLIVFRDTDFILPDNFRDISSDNFVIDINDYDDEADFDAYCREMDESRECWL
jgi:hypothetical protein